MENYKITGRAGEGAHGYVFQGVDLRNDKVVALKKITVNPDLGIPKNTMREICTLRALKAKNIVKLFDVTSMGSSVVLVMEFLPCSLQEILKNNALTVPQTKTYSKMLLKGLYFMHKNHIMHRDIKPANLLISPKRILKIGDFGLARIYNEKVTRQYSHQVATRWYRAPELLYGSRTYTPSVDMWSVGCIVAEMINRAPLFPEKDRMGHLPKSGVYSLSCDDCPAVYVGQSGRRISTRVREHSSFFKKYKDSDVTETRSAFANHLFAPGHSFSAPENLQYCMHVLKGETDIEQLAIVLSTLGSPTEENWPDLKKLPDYNKISFISSPGKSWRIILPKADSVTLDLLKKILLYDGSKRLTAKEALKHNFFNEEPKPAELKDMPNPDDYTNESPRFDAKDFNEIIAEINKI